MRNSKIFFVKSPRKRRKDRAGIQAVWNLNFALELAKFVSVVRIPLKKRNPHNGDIINANVYFFAPF